MAVPDSEKTSREFFYCGDLVASLSLGIVIRDAGGTITYANAAAERILGQSLDQMRGVTSVDPHWRAVREDAIPFRGVDQQAMVALKTGTAQPDIVIGVYHPNADTPIWINVSATPIWNTARDTVLAVYSVFQDITLRRKVETSLLEQQLQYRIAIETSMDGFMAVDPVGRIIEVNGAYQALSGYRRDELLRMSIMDLEAREDRAETEKRIREVMHRGNDLFESEHRTKDGLVWPVEVALNYSPGEGGKFYAFIRNITRRKLFEQQSQQFEALAQSSQDAIIGKTLDGTVTSWNPAAEAIFGYSATEMIGQPLRCLFPSSLYGEEADILARIQHGEAAHHLETVRLRKDGTEINVSVTVSSICDPRGTVIGVSTIARDITERVRNDRIQGARLRLMTCAASHTLKELLVATLDEAGEITHSPIGFYHFLEPDQKTLSLQAWSTQTTRAYCNAAGEGSHYNIDEAGVWVECIRLRQPVIHNDYASLPNKRGLPPGHAPLIRELVVPVFRKGLIVALLGVGNKATNYSPRDLETITLLADLAWDFAESKRANDALRESEERFRQAMEATRDGVWDWNIATDVNYFSPAWYRMLGYEPGEFAATSAHWASLIHPEDHERVLACNNECIDNLRPDFEIEYRLRTKGGDWKWLLSRGKAASRDAQGHALRMVGTHFDITERKETELQINFLAYHDQLTGLPNRTLFFDRFSQAISFAKRSGQQVALLFLDLDGFKPVNDLYGHDAGDIVLKMVADRLQNTVRAIDTVARLGGDEFAVVLGQLIDSAEAGSVGNKLLMAVAQPITLSDQTTVNVAASIGVSVYPDNGSEMDVLLAQADSAMYESKDHGRNRLTFWNGVNVQKTSDALWIQMGDEHLVGFKEMDDQHRELVRLVNELNAAIRAKEDSANIALRFSGLVEFTKFHFATEHQYMERFRFPGKKAHDMAHGRLLMDISHFNAMINRGGDLFVLQSIKDWLLHHIQAEDKKLGEFLSQQATR